MTDWPTAAELITFCTTNGLTIPSTEDAELALASAIKLFETDTGWSPFIASSTASVRYFDPPPFTNEGKLLFLEAGIPVEASLAAISFDHDFTDGSYSAADTDGYLLNKYNAEDESAPYDSIYIFSALSSQRKSIRISAKWGYSADGTCPDMAYSAVMRKAAMMSQANPGSTLAANMLRLGEQSIMYGTGTLGTKWREYQLHYDEAVAVFRRE